MRRLLVLLVACADPGDPPVQTPLVTVSTDKGFVEVTTPTYTMGFSPGGLHLPDSLKVGGRELFATGRIVREDRSVVPGTTTLTNVTGPCGCDNGGGTPFFFTSFWAFEEIQDANAHVDKDGNPTTGGMNQACTIYPDRAVAVSW